MTLLNLSGAPADPIRRLVWLSGVADQVRNELDAEYRTIYYEARLSGRLDAAIAMRLHSRKKIMAYTRAGNEERGRTVRWNDGR